MPWQVSKYPVIRTNNIDISATVAAVICGFLITQGRKGKKEKEAFLQRHCELAAKLKAATL